MSLLEYNTLFVLRQEKNNTPFLLHFNSETIRFGVKNSYFQKKYPCFCQKAGDCFLNP